MADQLFEIPLFPLNVVLFPGMALPLHIFEPRYRKMTADCLADNAPFGVVLVQSESELEATPSRVGTLARIHDYEELPDGRFNMLTIGTSRFEIVEIRNTKPYLTGLVRPLPDSDDDAVPSSLLEDARTALNEYLRIVLALVGSEERKIEIPEEAEDLSFLIGVCLTCEDSDKQEILEMTSLTQRLRTGIKLLRMEAEVLTRQIDNGVRPAINTDRSMLN